MKIENMLDLLIFKCNICGAENGVESRKFHREMAHCQGCGSNVRFRGVVHALSVALFGKSIPLVDFPCQEIHGIGMSDWPGYADILAERLQYKNTFYHCDPHLDLIDNSSVQKWVGQDFIISSDVIEHVPPPVQRSFDNLFAMLKPGGVLVLTVPFTSAPETAEHFPDLYEYEVVQFKGQYVLINRTASGVLWVRDDLVFHGGPGSTLEMRVFAQGQLLKHLEKAGFSDLSIYNRPVEGIGYYWPDQVMTDGHLDLGYVMTARRPK